jgi:uncharacterized protein YoxC
MESTMRDSALVDKLISIVMTVVMILIFNYPMYRSLKSTIDEVTVIVESVEDEVIIWQGELSRVRNQLNIVRSDIVNSINSGVAQTEATLNKVKALESDIKLLGNKIDSFKVRSVDKVKKAIEPEKINKKVKDIKKDSINKFKSFIDGR